MIDRQNDCADSRPVRDYLDQPAAGTVNPLGDGDAQVSHSASSPNLILETSCDGGPIDTDTLSITAAAPLATNNEIGGNAVGGDRPGKTVIPHEEMDISATIDRICELQVRRVFYIKRINMLDNAVRALARRALGWRWDAPEAARSRINRRAAKIVSAIQNDKPLDPSDTEVGNSVMSDVLVCDAARGPLIAARDEVEADMRRAVRTLPVWRDWAKDVAGVGEIGLAVIVGETGDLNNYATPSRVWKRLGLAVIDGERQRKKTDADQAAAHGYNPRRRAEIWSCVGDPLFRAQSAWIDKKTGEIKKPAGPYRLIYDHAKERLVSEGKATRPAHAHAHGTRLMTKRFLLDLWNAWRVDAGGVLSESDVRKMYEK